MEVSDLDFDLPEEHIAQAPVEPRDASRLLHLPLPAGAVRHLLFSDLPSLLRPGDLLVLNDSRVIPARLVGTKESGGKVEVLLVEPSPDARPGEPARWIAMAQASKAIRAGARLSFGDLRAEVAGVRGEGFYEIRFDREEGALHEALERVGQVPLPPYIRREAGAADRESYQTVLARAPGSVAAPTAGLHFTPALLARLDASGVERATVHVGPGTFLPVRAVRLEEHRMHAERYEVPETASRAFAAARERGGRVVAVGTTAVRTLESAWEGGGLRSGPGRTEIFIRPGHTFRAVDGLVTNFHLPRSTLLALACAFGGTERVLEAYRVAVAARYRFFSYGDAMVMI
jgi:S-adenosylmethionine:tRNA ribosyltransferase-isomerase